MDSPSLFSLHGRNALVTGAGQEGLGAYAAAGLAAAGASLVLSDLASATQGLLSLKSRLEMDGHAPVHVMPCDITDEDAVEGLVTRAEGAVGGLDILAHFSGVNLRKPCLEMSLAEWNSVIDVNLTGTWLINRAVGRRMVGRRSGKIVNAASVYFDRVGPLPESSYYASKAGVANLTRALATEFAPSGVTVNCVAPGIFHPTAMTAALDNDSDMLEWMRNRTLVQRVGSPERDIAGTVVFLASEASDYIVGQVISVDGGWSSM